jgi:hypothetical protein
MSHQLLLQVVNRSCGGSYAFDPAGIKWQQSHVRIDVAAVKDVLLAACTQWPSLAGRRQDGRHLHCLDAIFSGIPIRCGALLY